MNAHTRLLTSMRLVLNEAGIFEVPASGEFCFADKVTALFPGAVYGFAACFTETEKEALFNEAQNRRLCRPSDISLFKPIIGNLYPIYWGKDKQLGARPYQHLNNPKDTGAVRLSTYDALKRITIACATLVVPDNASAEIVIQTAFPDLLKTTTKQHVS